MPTEVSIRQVENLKSLFLEASILIATDFRGMSVSQMVGLRRSLRASGGGYRVVKNTLAKVAADEIDRPAIKEILDGPAGLVLTVGDPVNVAKALVEHIRVERLTMAVGKAVMGVEVLSEERVLELAALPPMDQLLSKMLGQMNAPISGLVTVLDGPVRGLVTVLQGHIKQSIGEESGVVDD